MEGLRRANERVIRQFEVAEREYAEAERQRRDAPVVDRIVDAIFPPEVPPPPLAPLKSASHDRRQSGVPQGDTASTGTVLSRPRAKSAPRGRLPAGGGRRSKQHRASLRPSHLDSGFGERHRRRDYEERHGYSWPRDEQQYTYGSGHGRGQRPQRLASTAWPQQQQRAGVVGSGAGRGEADSIGGADRFVLMRIPTQHASGSDLHVETPPSMPVTVPTAWPTGFEAEAITAPLGITLGRELRARRTM